MFKVFKKYPNIIAAVSGRKDGEMKWQDDLEMDKKAKVARETFFKKVGVDSAAVVSGDLVHGSRVAVVGKQDAGRLAATDGLITKDKEVFLTVTVADCLPVFLFDPKREVVGMVHAGWRGLASGIIEEAVREMQRDFSCEPHNILVAIGPGIGDCHYEVQDDVIGHFGNYAHAVTKKDGKTFLNLKKIAALQLQQAGIAEKNIEMNPICTYCNEETYFSFRRDKPEKVHAMVAAIGMQK